MTRSRPAYHVANDRNIRIGHQWYPSLHVNPLCIHADRGFGAGPEKIARSGRKFLATLKRNAEKPNEGLASAFLSLPTSIILEPSGRKRVRRSRVDSENWFKVPITGKYSPREVAIYTERTEAIQGRKLQLLFLNFVEYIMNRFLSLITF